MRETHSLPSREFPAMGSQPNDAQDKAQAVAELLRTKSLTTTLGLHGEYEVRTTIVTRQIWRYRCSVLVDWKEIRRGRLRPIAVDRSRQIRKEPVITEELRRTFATEAVEAHFARRAMVAEYVLRAPSIWLPLSGRYRPRTIALLAVIVISLLSVSWLWRNPSGVRPETLPAHSPPPMVEWEQTAVPYQFPVGEAFTVSLPTGERTPTDVPVTVTREPVGEQTDLRVPPLPIEAAPSTPDPGADTDPEPSLVDSPPSPVWWQQPVVFDPFPAEEWLTVPLTALEYTPPAVPVAVTRELPGEWADHRVPLPPISAAPTASDPPAEADPGLPLAHSPPSVVAWHQAAASYQLAADEPFTIPLPTLERTPAGVPVEVTLERLGDKPSWLIFDQEHLQLSGTPPRATKNQTYALIFRAKAENGGESQFQLALTIMAETTPFPSPRQNSPGPTLPNRSADANCLLKILQGEPCQHRAAEADCVLKTLKGEPCQSR
jgi:Putative Ig domain